MHVTGTPDQEHLRRRGCVQGVDGTGAPADDPSACLLWVHACLQGKSICDVVDVFREWRERTDSDDMELLLLALISKEQDVPGGWVHGCGWPVVGAACMGRLVGACQWEEEGRKVCVCVCVFLCVSVSVSISQ